MDITGDMFVDNFNFDSFKFIEDNLSSCFPVMEKNNTKSIFFFTNEQHIRNLKLKKIDNKYIPNKITMKGVCLFQLDRHSKVLYCDTNVIWKKVENEYGKHVVLIRDMKYKLSKNKYTVTGNSVLNHFGIPEENKNIKVCDEYYRNNYNVRDFFI